MNYDTLLKSILSLHRDSVGRAAVAINQALLLRNWLIGAYLVLLRHFERQSYQ